jgi:beta-mannosidase
VRTTIKHIDGETAVAVSSPVLVKNLYLNYDDVDGIFSDNYFDLLPGTTKVVRFRPTGAKPPRQAPKLMHMAEIVT